MNKDMDAQFLCKDCARYNLCEYYHKRKEDSYICKYFHLPENLNKCGDLISRQAVENITWEEPSYADPLNVLTEVREKVRALPSAEDKTQMIDKSNFDTDQYKADLQSAFESGYYKGKIDGIKECTAKLEKMNEELANG